MLNNNNILFQMSASIKMLSAEALNICATGGHLGTAIGASDLTTCLFSNFLSCNPKNPLWYNRDRFILSAGHAAILQYSVLHLLGYDKFSTDSLKNLRNKDSITSGHPEHNPSAGIEVTTGPLGQGLAMSVGMALGERILNSKFPEIIEHCTFALVGDGCLQEGVSYEALSLASTLGLNKLIVIYDYNNITIDGKAELSNVEDISMRMKALGFNVIEIDGHDYSQINNALNQAKNVFAKTSKKPTFILSRSKIAHMVPNKEGTSSAHGGALSQEELSGLKKNLGWTSPAFDIPSEIKEHWENVASQKIQEAQEWEAKFQNYAKKEEFLEFLSRDLSANTLKELDLLAQEYISTPTKMATRIASSKVLEKISAERKNLIGGSADLSSSNNTIHKNSKSISANEYNGNYIHYGIREHAMGAVMNGLSCYGLSPYGGTFLIFSDYMRPAIRLSALMDQPVIYIFSHDNISLGADGPTHQPVEQLPSLRLIPNLEVLRPCDMIETIEAYKLAFEYNNRPIAMILGRDVVEQVRTSYITSENKVKLGAYAISKDDKAVVNLISSGSEVYLVNKVAEDLKTEGVIANVISVPSLNIFADSSKEYKKELLGDRLNFVVEAARMSLWTDVLGSNTVLYGIDSFGLSASASDTMDYFGFTVEKIKSAVKQSIS